MVLLTREEEAMLNGDYGEAVARAMEIIVRTAESLDAERLVKIKHAHISGVSYGTIGDPGAAFLEEFARMGARFRVPASVNPIGYDPENREGEGILRLDQRFINGQQRILRALKKMGADLLLTCTPYYTDLFSQYGLEIGDSVAWGESSAVAYANTVLGIKTNREGGPLALMAAITGRTYYYGLHIPENRQPKTKYMYNRDYDEVTLGIIAEYLANYHEDTYPPMIALPYKPKDYMVREYAAALGAAGSIAMSVVPGVTPLVKKPDPTKTVDIDHNYVSVRKKELGPTGTPDLVFIGCPHASMEELTILNNKIKEKVSIPILVTLSKDVYHKAQKLGLIESLSKKGIKFLRSTCLIVSRTRNLAIATNSYKALFYLSRKLDDVYLLSIKEIINLVGW